MKEGIDGKKEGIQGRIYRQWKKEKERRKAKGRKKKRRNTRKKIRETIIVESNRYKSW